MATFRKYRVWKNRQMQKCDLGVVQAKIFEKPEFEDNLRLLKPNKKDLLHDMRMEISVCFERAAESTKELEELELKKVEFQNRWFDVRVEKDSAKRGQYNCFRFSEMTADFLIGQHKEMIKMQEEKAKFLGKQYWDIQNYTLGKTWYPKSDRTEVLFSDFDSEDDTTDISESSLYFKDRYGDHRFGEFDNKQFEEDENTSEIEEVQ